MDYIRLSKEISHALRHAPWKYELELDAEGFVPVEQLLSAINESGKYDRAITADDIRHIIEISDKQRFEISGDRIRALYGHTIPMRIQKVAAVPPPVLYHGTTHKSLPLILTKGLLPMSRQYVHLSADTETAEIVGKRRDPHPVILKINTAAAMQEGAVFYIGNEKVWLCDSVAPQFIEVKDEIWHLL